ncbi:MAG: hypothetical protein AAGB93_19420 [Planctomycetota bacterium]
MTAPIDRALGTLAATGILLLLGACGGPRGPERYADDEGPSTGEQASNILNAKEDARLAVVDDVYDEWNRAHLEFQGELEAAGANVAEVEGGANGRGPGWSATEPVRTLEELLAALEPAAADPLLAEPIERWRAACREFDQRLRALDNDPSTDPRNPLRPR